MNMICTAFGRLLIATPLIAYSLGAIAQQVPNVGSDTGTNASPLTRPPAPPSEPYPNDASQGYLFNLRPIGENFGAALASDGIYLTGRTLQEAVGETSGGIKQGTSYEGFNLFGVDLDLNRIAGIRGGSVHVLINDLAGTPYQNYSGSLYVYNRAFAYQSAARLNEFSYEQNFSGLLDLRIGRIPVGSEFDTEPVYCQFIYGLCGFPAGLAFDKGYPAYLAASWVGIAKVKLPYHFYVHAGIFEDEPSLATQGHLGFPGEDWAPDKARGATIPVQIGYHTDFNDDPYPRSYAVGGYVDTGDYTDPLDNAAGLNRALHGGAPRLDHGKSGIWLQADQTIWRPDMTTTRNLQIFSGANIQTSGEANIASSFFAGFSLKGPFSGRPNDTLNLSGTVFDLNYAYTQFVDSELDVRGIHQGVSGTEAYVELNYGMALAPGVMLKPNFEYIWNPDQVGVPVPVATDKHAIFIGVALSAFLPETLGLPRLGGS
jgi:porin